MPPTVKACPRCGHRLEIPQPPPERVACPQCRSAFSIAPVRGGVAAGPPPATPPAAASPVQRSASPDMPETPPPRRALGAILLLAGLGVAVVGGLVLAVILLRDPAPAPEPGTGGNLAFGPAPKPPPPDPRIKIVQPAVDRGVAFLKARMLAKEAFPIVDNRIPDQSPGIAGLIGLTLLECGVSPEDPAVLRAAEIIREQAPRMNKIYVLSAALFFLNRWHEIRPLNDRDRQLAQTFALRIIAGQFANGVWGYDGVPLTPKDEALVLASLRGGTHKPTRRVRLYSISNTQFAMLALWGARKHGVPVRDSLLAAAAHFNATQLADGHWLYSNHHADQLGATTTCAGLMALAIEKALREDREFVAKHEAADPSKKRADLGKAFAYLAKSIGRKKGDPGGAAHGYIGTIFQADAWGDLYFLWSVERVGVIYGESHIGGKDWYDWGYPIVMRVQAPDGSWSDRHGPLVDTCFALLFLKRANIAKDLTEKLRELARGPRAQAAPVPPLPRREGA